MTAHGKQADGYAMENGERREQMGLLKRPTTLTQCKTEYGVLKDVIVCEPKHMTLRNMINETQKKFKNEDIHIEIAMEQHHEFVRVLKKHGVNVHLLPVNERYPEQVFTRDIGFTLGQTTFVADMAHDVRKGEENTLKEWLELKGISYYNLVSDEIEGGDVIIDRHSIYIGISNRTNMAAIEHIQRLLPEYEVIPVPFHPKYLHLDCVFNIVSPHEALIYPGVMNRKEEKLIASRYDLIEVTEEEQFTLGTNVLSIGHKRVISLPVNTNVNEQLRKRGFDVIEVDITEIIKSGGSFRCCTMPLRREDDV
jgi:N-dimethylarginine dimethylaminohydrolase